MATQGIISNEIALRIRYTYRLLQDSTEPFELLYVTALEMMSEDEVRRMIREAIGP